jgi:hypothetical protein
MEEFEINHIAHAPIRPHFMVRYVDDMFAIWTDKSEKLTEFLEHLNSGCPTIKFTAEMETDNALPFLDCKVVRTNIQGDLQVSVYHKPTFSGRFLNYFSNHAPSIKSGIVRTLATRAKRICSDIINTQNELNTIQSNLMENGFPASFCHRNISKVINPSAGIVENKPQSPIVVIPYIPALSLKIARFLAKFNVKTVFSSNRTLRQIWSFKPKSNYFDRKGAIYKIHCDCDKIYIGETERRLSARIEDHKKYVSGFKTEISPLAEHSLITGCAFDWNDTKILDNDSNSFRRKVKEAFYIKKDKPNLNRDKGYTISENWLL